MTPQQIEIEPTPALHDFPTLSASTRSGTSPPKFVPHRKGAVTPVTEVPRTVRVALAGCGVVGGGLVRLLHESAPAVAARFGVRFALTRVLVRDTGRERNLPIDPRLFTNDLDAFLSHDADVVIEAVGGEEPARTIARAALTRGSKLITANKDLVASYGDSLSALAHEHHSSLDFGAAVGGSAPVISTLRDLVGASTPESVRGILNGTSNYVITLIERGVSLDSALASARERGLAESDCARDLDGRDAAAKLAIIAWIAFGIRPADLHVRRTSLVPGLERLVRTASINGARVRFIAECRRLSGNRVTAAVEPVIIPAESAFARTILEENRVDVDLGWSSPLSVSGPGAGGTPTAAALLSDLLRVTPAPNDRGAGATQFLSVADPREHRWLVATHLDSDALQRTAAAVGLGSERYPADAPGAAIITAPASWESVQRLIGALDSVNERPLVARYDCTEVEVSQ